MKKDRIYFLDYTKAIGILFIMMAHTFMWTRATHFVCDVVCSVHVPIFFIASGLLLSFFPREESLVDYIKKRSTALLVPYFWFSILNAVQTWGVLFFTHKMDSDRLKAESIELFITGNGTVWFLVTLFLAELLYFGFNRIEKHKNVLLIISAILAETLAFGLNGVFQNPVWVVISRALAAYGFIVVGRFLCYLTQIKTWKKVVVAIAMFALWLSLFIYSSYNFEFFLGRFDNAWSSIPIIISGSICIILILSCIKRKLPVFEYIGKNSLLFMLCHPTFIKMYIFAGKGYVASQSPSMQVILSVVVFIVVILGSAIFGEIVKRYIPFVIGRKC